MTRRINPYKLFYGIWIPNWLLERKEVSSGAKLCYGALCRFAGRNGRCWPGQEAVADVLGVSIRQVQRHLQDLLGLGLIEQVQRGHMKSNVYYFLDHPWIREDTPADDDVPERASADDHDTTDVSGHEATDMSYRRESSEESQLATLADNKTPSARNLNSSGEKMGAWLVFLQLLDSSREMGILSPVDNPEPYARKAARSGSSPPSTNITLLKRAATAVKVGMRLKTVRLPKIEHMEDTANWFGRIHDHHGTAKFLLWLGWASSKVERKGSLADDRLLLHALTQVGVLAPFSEWQAARAVVA